MVSAWLLLPALLLASSTGSTSPSAARQAPPVSTSACPPGSTARGGLFQRLNLSYTAGLAPVAAALHRDDTEAACSLLLRYYQGSGEASWLRKPVPQPGSGHAGGAADAALNDTYSFYTVQARVPRDPRTGSLDWGFTGPNHDVEFMYALNRFAVFGSLLAAWEATGNPVYSRLYANLTADWAAVVPFPAKPTAEGEWRTLEAGIRAGGSWPDGFYGFLQAAEVPPAAKLTAALVLAEHGAFLEQFGLSGNANWRSMQMSGLTAVALTLPEFANATRWYATAMASTLSDFRTGVYPDGVETEETAHYHRVATANFFHAINISKLAGRDVSPELADGVERMWSYLAYSMDQWGYAPLNSDADLDYNRDLIREMAGYYDRPDWLFIASAGEAGTAPNSTTAVFPWAGQVVMRNTFAQDPSAAHWAWLDVGPFGSSSHGHRDKLHLSMRCFGEQQLVDSGRFAYSGDIAAKFSSAYAHHTRGHNAMVLDGQQQSSSPAVAKEAITSYNVSDVAQRDWAYSNVLFEKLEGTAAHTRGVYYQRGLFWAVVDRVVTDRPRHVELNWHTHPDCNFSQPLGLSGPISTISCAKGSRLVMVGASTGGFAWGNATVIKGQSKPVPQGWYSPQYDQYEASEDAQFVQPAAGNLTTAWLLVPTPAGRPAPTATLAIVEATAGGLDAGVTLDITLSGARHTIRVPVSSIAAG